MKAIIVLLIVVWVVMILLAYIIITQTQGESIFNIDEELPHLSPFLIQHYI